MDILVLLITKIKQLHKLVWELLKVNHYLLLGLQDVVVLLTDVQRIDKERVLLIGKLKSQHLTLGVRRVWSMNCQFYGELPHIIFTVMGSDSNTNGVFKECPCKLELRVGLAWFLALVLGH